MRFSVAGRCAWRALGGGPAFARTAGCKIWGGGGGGPGPHKPLNPTLRRTSQGGGGNPFDMKNLMESVKKAQQLVQTETARVQGELAA